MDGMRVVGICVTSFKQNCLLLICENTKQAVIVDPGGDLRKIKAAVSDAGASVQSVILTHGHIDHCGAALDTAIEFNVPIQGPHIFDSFWLENLELQATMFGLPLPKKFLPDYWLKEGDEITFGSQILKVLHCPGHTPGHIALFNCASAIAIIGDILFAGSVGRTDLPKGNKKDLLHSIQKKLWLLGNHVKLYPGHGQPTTIDHERRNNPFVGDGKTLVF